MRGKTILIFTRVRLEDIRIFLLKSFTVNLEDKGCISQNLMYTRLFDCLFLDLEKANKKKFGFNNFLCYQPQYLPPSIDNMKFNSNGQQHIQPRQD